MTDQDLNALFAEWAAWVRSKALYSPNPHPRSILGALRMPSGHQDGPSAPLSAEMARLHLAIMGSGDRGQLIVAHYLLRPYERRQVGVDERGMPVFKRRLIKELAYAAGIEPASWARSVKRACRDVHERMCAVQRLEYATETAECL